MILYPICRSTTLNSTPNRQKSTPRGFGALVLLRLTFRFLLFKSPTSSRRSTAWHHAIQWERARCGAGRGSRSRLVTSHVSHVRPVSQLSELSTFGIPPPSAQARLEAQDSGAMSGPKNENPREIRRRKTDLKYKTINF